MDKGIGLFRLIKHAIWSREVDLVANGFLLAFGVGVGVSRENDASKRTDA